MKRLMMILVVAGILSAGFADASEHSALSNVFTLDTRWVPMQHSALSNIFTLDTRDVVSEAEPWDVNGDGVVERCVCFHSIEAGYFMGIRKIAIVR